MRVERFIASGEPCEAQLAMQEMMRDTDPHKNYSKMIRLRLRGEAADQCHDVYYTAIDGERAVARHWMGWGRHEHSVGNWGNFFTLEEYRGRGIGGSLLSKWQEDLYSADHAPLPIGLFCTAGNTDLTRLYSKFGFRPAIKGTDFGPLYMPIGDSPRTFRDLCELYYERSDTLIRMPASLGYRHEIDCLFKFYLIDNGERLGIGEVESLEELLLSDPGRAEIFLTPKNRCVGWAVDGKTQIHPLYEGASVV